MKKTFFLFFCIGCSVTAFAGLVDHEDCIDFPNVNVDAHLLKIARYHYPDASPDLPEGISPNEAWEKDIREAAKGLNIPEDQLKKFIDFVQNSPKRTPIEAPHKKLLEFELYAKGRNGLYFKESEVLIPSAWNQLLALPLEQRRYTTIPVLYSIDRRAAGRQEEVKGHYLNQITDARKKGCIDSQGLERALNKDIPNWYFMMTDDLSIKEHYYHQLLREFAMNWFAEKEWRYVNDNDIWSWARFRGDRFYSGEEMSYLRFYIYTEEEKILRELCKRMPSLRDFVVGIGLTNRQMLTARKMAAEFAKQSPLNYPVLALRLPLADAEKLLADKPEHAQLLALLRLKKMSGMEKIKAIDDYIAKYPDYTADDMPVTSIALHTHAELQAFAGLEYYKLGQYTEALKRWMKGGTPEDIGLIAEQIFSTEELLDFCRKYATETALCDFDVSSCQCAENNKILYPNIIWQGEYLVRNILAHRLMREKRYAEALQWFTGNRHRYYPELFIRLNEKLNDPALDSKSKLETTLTMASLIRSKGDFLFGTFLEPDNVICEGRYPCQWGLGIKNPKLQKPDLPRFHYRWIAADYYRKAADLTDDPQLKGFCFWMAGTLLKYRDPKLANSDYRKLVQIAPTLIEKNWFKKRKDVPENIQQWSRQSFFIFGADRVAAWKPYLPEVEKVNLPENDGSLETLIKLGQELYEKTTHAGALEYKQAMYALSLAGQKGSAEGYFWCGVIQATGLSHYEPAIAYFKKALEIDPELNPAKHELGRAYLDVGLWPEGIALIRHVADTEKKDKKLIGMATFNMSNFYRKGLYGMKQDAEKAAYYLKKSADAGFPQAVELQNEGE